MKGTLTLFSFTSRCFTQGLVVWLVWARSVTLGWLSLIALTVGTLAWVAVELSRDGGK